MSRENPIVISSDEEEDDLLIPIMDSVYINHQLGQPYAGQGGKKGVGKDGKKGMDNDDITGVGNDGSDVNREALELVRDPNNNVIMKGSMDYLIVTKQYNNKGLRFVVGKDKASGKTILGTIKGGIFKGGNE